MDGVSASDADPDRADECLDLMKVIVTGAAGFIVDAVCERLLARSEQLVGVDNLNGNYDPNLKKSKLKRLEEQAPFTLDAGPLISSNIADITAMSELFAAFQRDRVIHLAA